VLDDPPGVGDRLVVDVEHRDVRLAGQLLHRVAPAASQPDRLHLDPVAA
jgi:hypothetical protein